MHASVKYDDVGIPNGGELLEGSGLVGEGK